MGGLKMVRFALSILCTIALGVGASAQEAMIAAKAPIYESGEHSQGVVILQNGVKFLLNQTAQRAADGNIYLYSTMSDPRDPQGRALVSTVTDPIKWRQWTATPWEKTSIVKSDCSHDKLYPVRLGKEYSCSSLIQINDRQVMSRIRITYTDIRKNAQGIVLEVCLLQEANDEDAISLTRVCRTPDGKWVRSMETLSIVPLQRT